MPKNAAPAMTPTQEMALIHRLFRRESQNLLRFVSGAGDTDVARARQLARAVDDYILGLHHHHRAEDELIWPKLHDRAEVHDDLVQRMEAQRRRPPRGARRARPGTGAPECSAVCYRHAVIPLDLLRQPLDAALAAAGFRTDLPVLWVLEGLTGYLTRTAVENLCRVMAELSAPGSTVRATFVGPSGQAYGSQAAPSRRHSFVTDDGMALFEAAGWRATAERIGDVARAYARNELLDS